LRTARGLRRSLYGADHKKLISYGQIPRKGHHYDDNLDQDHEARADRPGAYSGLRAHSTLDYGQTRSVGVMICASEASGVTCTDTSTGHFFRVSRDSYQLG
jgi:hypothetical protein